MGGIGRRFFEGLISSNDVGICWKSDITSFQQICMLKILRHHMFLKMWRCQLMMQYHFKRWSFLRIWHQQISRKVAPYAYMEAHSYLAQECLPCLRECCDTTRNQDTDLPPRPNRPGTTECEHYDEQTVSFFVPSKESSRRRSSRRLECESATWSTPRIIVWNGTAGNWDKEWVWKDEGDSPQKDRDKGKRRISFRLVIQ